MRANSWSQCIAPFRHSMRQLAKPAETLLAELDALDAWCSQLVAPALPAAATLDSPFAGLPTPDLSAPVRAAEYAKESTAAPVGDRAMHRASHALQAAAAAHPTQAKASLSAPSAPPSEVTAPGAAPHSPSGAGKNGARPAFPLRGGKPAPAPSVSPVHSRGALHPAEPPSSGQAAARMLQPEELLPRTTAFAAGQRAGDQEASLPPLTSTISPAGASPEELPARKAMPEPSADAGLRLLAALTASLTARPAVIDTRTKDAPPLAPAAAAVAVPWRIAGAHGSPPSTVPPFPPATPGSIEVRQPTPAAPQPRVPHTAQAGAFQPIWPSTGQPPVAPLDPDLLADLVNEALLEQARRHGAHLP